MQHAPSTSVVDRPLARLARCLVALAAAAGISASSAQDPFTGIWKSHCSDYWAVQVQPAGPGFYAVTFCGLSGCLKRGEWMPDTRIERDPAYDVAGDGALRIRRVDNGYFSYSRCSTDPAWQAGPAR